MRRRLRSGHESILFERDADAAAPAVPPPPPGSPLWAWPMSNGVSCRMLSRDEARSLFGDLLSGMSVRVAAEKHDLPKLQVTRLRRQYPAEWRECVGRAQEQALEALPRIKALTYEGLERAADRLMEALESPDLTVEQTCRAINSLASLAEKLDVMEHGQRVVIQDERSPDERIAELSRRVGKLAAAGVPVLPWEQGH